MLVNGVCVDVLKCVVVSWHMALYALSPFVCLFVVSENQILVGTEVSLFSTVIRRKLCSKLVKSFRKRSVTNR